MAARRRGALPACSCRTRAPSTRWSRGQLAQLAHGHEASSRWRAIGALKMKPRDSCRRRRRCGRPGRARMSRDRLPEGSGIPEERRGCRRRGCPAWEVGTSVILARRTPRTRQRRLLSGDAGSLASLAHEPAATGTRVSRMARVVDGTQHPARRRPPPPPELGVSASRCRTLAHRGRAGAVPAGHDLGHDRQRGLRGRPSAEIEADRPAAERCRRHQLRGEETLTPGCLRRAMPMALTYRQSRSSAARMAGSSTLGSWLRTAAGIGWSQVDLVGDLVRPADDASVDVRKRSAVTNVDRGSTTSTV